MTKYVLSLALALSMLINLALLRREPTANPAPPASPPAVSAPTTVRPVARETDGSVLRGKLRARMAERSLAPPALAIDGTPEVPATVEEVDDPDARELQEVSQLVGAFVETRDQGGALGAIEDHLGLQGEERRHFREWALAAIDAYRRLQDADLRDLQAAAKAAEHDEYFEDAGLRDIEVSARMEARREQWSRDSVQPIRNFLARRNGVRPALLSRNLAELLMVFGSAGDR